MNSAGQPDITPSAATWRTFTSRIAGGIAPSESSALRSVKSRNSFTASSVNGTVGSPSEANSAVGR